MVYAPEGLRVPVDKQGLRGMLDASSTGASVLMGLCLPAWSPFLRYKVLKYVLMVLKRLEAADQYLLVGRISLRLYVYLYVLKGS